MAVNEEQIEELEVLSSIFEDDSAYNQINEKCIQYKIGEDGAIKSFIIEFQWPDDYPQCLPVINLNAFYNKKLLPEVKEHIVNALCAEANNMIGEAMTFSLIDFAKDNQSDLTAMQPEFFAKPVDESASKKKEKKEQLTKAQKRRLVERFGGGGGERPRGWDWVDVVKHLSQTGKANEQANS